jgi:uncharacterized sulfatase
MKLKQYQMRQNIIPAMIILSAFSGCKNKQDEIKRPNILFAISDDQSFVHTSYMGCKFINTPAFDKVAKEGVYFSNCYAGSPGCAPSRSSIVTGRHHWQNEQSGQHASSWMKKYVPFIDLLDKNGYITGRTGKGVAPFQYARTEEDSLWRKTDAGGIEHSKIQYKKNTPEDKRFADGIDITNYYENFKYFMEKREKGKPFFFWYGGHEPHREFEKDSWKRTGKKLEDVTVPGFLPDNEVIRGDLLDYAVEIEWFDLHLQRMLEYLEKIGELENTIVVVTSDNGMSFPRAKANCFEYGVHVPFAVRFPKGFPGGRVVDDPVSFVDIAPTILELTNTSDEGMLPISGKSIADLLKSTKEGTISSEQAYILAGRERHSCSRWMNLGYPQRAIRNQQYLYIWNLKPERWPAGAPERINPENVNELLPMNGIDKEGKHHSEWAFTDVDECPSKAFLIENRKDEGVKPYFEMAFSKRSEVELYDVISDPFCLNNIAGVTGFADIQKKMKEALMNELKRSEDTRVVGENEGIFDTYLRYVGPMRDFPKPDWAFNQD